MPKFCQLFMKFLHAQGFPSLPNTVQLIPLWLVNKSSRGYTSQPQVAGTRTRLMGTGVHNAASI